MPYTKAQAKKIAAQIHSRFGSRIASACADSSVPPELLSGLIGVEAGKDSKGQLVETATRFEPHVFEKLKAVRNGKLAKYNNIHRDQLKDASDAALKALSKSYGLTQILGWWALHLKTTVGELRDPEKHLKFAVRLLEMNAGGYIYARQWPAVFRIWNTGRPTGKTYHADYVANATAVMEAYKKLRPVEPLAKSLVTDLVTEDPGCAGQET